MVALEVLFMLLMVWYFVSAIVLPIEIMTSTKEDRQDWCDFLWKRLNIPGKIIMYIIYFVLCPVITIIIIINFLFTVKKETKE